MKNFNLQWSKAPLSQLKDEIYAHFFAIVRGGKIVYIGNANHADLSTLVQDTLELLGFDQSVHEVYLGRIREYGSRRITDETINGLHQLLVYARKPYLNKKGKFRYGGLANLSLLNSGFQRLPGKVRAENRIVFLSSQMHAA